MPKKTSVNGKKNSRAKNAALRSGEHRSPKQLSARRQERSARLLGRYIVADPKICHGKPTFRGTRIMVWQVLEMVTEGMAWESIVEEWEGSISKEAIAEAVQLAYKSFLKHPYEHALEPIAA
jgi:uncharacterized protein (DUF433 family)